MYFIFHVFDCLLNTDNPLFCRSYRVQGFNVAFDLLVSFLNSVVCFWIFLTNRSSMLLSHWLPDHRAKLLRTTWMSSKTSGRSRSECSQKLWMTSPQWMTSFLSQVITNRPLPRQLEEKNRIRSILQRSWVSVSSVLLGPLSFHSSLQM